MNELTGENGVAAALHDAPKWAGEQLATLDKQVRRLVTEHPIAALACAVGVGFLAARLLRGPRSR